MNGAMRMGRMHAQHGMSLVELMVAMTIGLFLIGGAFYVYTGSRGSMAVTDTVARMQERARFALDVIEPDLRLADYWGLHNESLVIEGRTTPANPTGIPVLGQCGAGWTTDLDTAVEGRDQDEDPWADCTTGLGLAPDADALVVRHAGETPIDTAALQDGFIYVRTDETLNGALFVGTAESGGFGPTAQNRFLIANAYYIRTFSFGDADDNDGWPSLRRLMLNSRGGAPAMVDQEVIPGIEDLQIQLGVDTDVPGAPGRGSVNRYVDPDNAILDPADAAFLPNAQVLAVRVWLVVRAENAEPGFVDDRTYRYADREYTVPQNLQGFRRLLVSRTVFLRNERDPV